MRIDFQLDVMDKVGVVVANVKKDQICYEKDKRIKEKDKKSRSEVDCRRRASGIRSLESTTPSLQLR